MTNYLVISKSNIRVAVCAFAAVIAATAAPLAHAGTYLGYVSTSSESWGAGWDACRARYKNTNYIKKGKVGVSTPSGNTTYWDCYKN
jgi:hypothetical protein